MTREQNLCDKIILNFSNFSFFIRYFFTKFIQIIYKVYNYVYCIIFENEREWLIIRSISSCLFGILLAFLFWEFIIFDLQFDTKLSYKSLLFFIIICGLGCTYSRKFRCTSILICAEFLGRAGRSCLRALVFAFIVSGPIRNLSLNGKEVIRVFACAAVLTFNLTHTRLDLMTKPFQNALFEMRNNMSSVQETFQNVEDVVNPLIEEVEIDDNNNYNGSLNATIERFYRENAFNLLEGDTIEKAEIYQNHYKDKLQKRCKNQLEKGENRCRKAFSDAYRQCHEKLPAIIDTILCWPMKITLVCNLEVFGFTKSGENSICDPTNVLDRNFGEDFNNLKETEKEFITNISSVKINYEFVSPKKIPVLKDAQETGEVLISEFNHGKLIFDKCMYVLNKVLAFIFIRVIISAIRYHGNYLKDINADNIYVTPYFKRIDKRRKERNQHSLLPLKKVENLTIIDPSKLKRSKSEKKRVIAHILKFGLELVTALIFLLIDHIVYVLLNIVRQNAKIEYIQEGEHVLIIKVNGTGLIAKLIRSTLKGFNINTEVHTVFTNEPCLPKPAKLSNWYYFKVLMLCLSIIIFYFNESITFRMKRVICSYFYPKREKRRVIHLYNQLLKRRRTLFVTMAREIRKQLIKKHKLQMKINILTKIRIKVPWLFGWLRKFKFARRQCLICREPEPKEYDKKRPFNFKDCETPGCFYVHCDECWFDIGEVCLACNQVILNSEEIDFSD